MMAIVDDDPGLAQALSTWLELHELRATHHITGESLLQQLRVEGQQLLLDIGVTSPVTFRLLGAVIDVNLPRMSGFETAHELRRLCPSLPMVLVTALPPEKQGGYGKLPAQVQCIQKPFSLSALEAALSPLMGAS